MPTLKQIAWIAGYQLSIAIGIMLLPVAVFVRQSGITIPMHRVVEFFQSALDNE